MKKIEKYEEIFVPGSPIRDKRYLFGRKQEFSDLQNILRRPGQHAIIIGYRGVGKTSLVKQVLKETNYLSCWRTCDPDSSFSEVFQDLLKNCGIDFNKTQTLEETVKEGITKVAPLQIGLEGKISRRCQETKEYFTKEELKPWRVYKHLESIKEKVVLVLDEYDALHYATFDFESPFHKSVAYTMKHLSDHSDICNSRLVIVGVANSAKELLGKHESIERSAREIYLRTLRHEDFFDFLDEAEKDLEIKFDSEVKYHLAYGSLGFPYYLHLVGLECIDSMLARDKKARIVTQVDLEIAKKKAVEKAFRSELRKYESVLYKLSRPEKICIKELALYPKISPPRQEICRYICKNNGISEAECYAAFLNLQQKHKFIYILRRTDEIRFVDPLMKPFLRDKVTIQTNEQAKLF